MSEKRLHCFHAESINIESIRFNYRYYYLQSL